jgi:hypothetical protein
MPLSATFTALLLAHAPEHRLFLPASGSGQREMLSCKRLANERSGERCLPVALAGTSAGDFTLRNALSGTRRRVSADSWMRLHGGGHRFEPGAVHHRFAGKSRSECPSRAPPKARLQPSCSPNPCAHTGADGAHWYWLGRTRRLTGSADIRFSQTHLRGSAAPCGPLRLTGHAEADVSGDRRRGRP